MATTAEPVEETKVSPIFEAAARGDVETVESTLAADASCATQLNDAGRTALSLAAARGHAKVVKMLLDAGATDSTVVGWTAVHHAAFGGHAEVRRHGKKKNDAR